MPLRWWYNQSATLSGKVEEDRRAALLKRQGDLLGPRPRGIYRRGTRRERCDKTELNWRGLPKQRRARTARKAPSANKTAGVYRAPVGGIKMTAGPPCKEL